MLVYAKNKELAKFNKVVLLDEKKKEFSEIDEIGFYKWKEFIRKDTLKGQKKAGFYPIYVSHVEWLKLLLYVKISSEPPVLYGGSI